MKKQQNRKGVEDVFNCLRINGEWRMADDELRDVSKQCVKVIYAEVIKLRDILTKVKYTRLVETRNICTMNEYNQDQKNARSRD